jgi:hypothetical protein
LDLDYIKKLIKKRLGSFGNIGAKNSNTNKVRDTIRCT